MIRFCFPVKSNLRRRGGALLLGVLLFFTLTNAYLIWTFRATTRLLESKLWGGGKWALELVLSISTFCREIWIIYEFFFVLSRSWNKSVKARISHFEWNWCAHPVLCVETETHQHFPADQKRVNKEGERDGEKEWEWEREKERIKMKNRKNSRERERERWVNRG